MGCLKRYDSVQDILKEFFELRLHYYRLRKDWLMGSLGAEAAKLSNQARFVLEKIEGKISIGKNFENTVTKTFNHPDRSTFLKIILKPEHCLFLKQTLSLPLKYLFKI